MRLSAQDAQCIRDTVGTVFGPQAHVWLFGSRTDPSARGGDIDLLVSVPHPVERPALLATQLAARLQMALGEQHIDIVLEAPNLQPLPIHRVAREQGVRL
jgi:predicted nucleotidyltransferase